MGQGDFEAASLIIVNVAGQQHELFTFEIYGQFGFTVDMFD